MLRNQEKLPRLPIPALDNLFEFLNWIKPIVDDEEFQTSQEALNEFLMTNADGKPKLYDSPGYKILKHDFISTSGVGFESISIFGFSPIVEDGYGIGYVINKRKINVSISTKMKNKDKGKELLKNLNDSFLLLESLVMKNISEN